MPSGQEVTEVIGVPSPDEQRHRRHDLDDLDARLIGLMRASPNLPVVEMARRLGVARGTVQARLARLHDRGVISGYGPEIARSVIGYDVLAFTTLEIAQGNDAEIIGGLARIPEVLEVHAVTGPGDLLCRIVTRSNQHLQEVLGRVLAVPGILRTETHLALGSPVDRSLADLVTSLAATNEASSDER